MPRKSIAKPKPDETSCPCGIVVETAEGKECGYIISIAPVSYTISGKDIFDLPTFAMIKILERIPPFGVFVGASYHEEGNHRYRIVVNPPKGNGHYKHVIHHNAILGETGSADARWSKVSPHSLEYRFRLKEKGPFEGRSWFKANLIVIWRHPDLRYDRELTRKLLSMALKVKIPKPTRKKSTGREPPTHIPPRPPVT